MSEDRLAQLHNILREPLRQKILLQLGEHDELSFDDLKKNLKIDDYQELNEQLSVLEKLTVEDEHLLSKQTNLQYKLTEKGHCLLDEMIAFPELEADGYKEKIMKGRLKLGKEIYIIVGASVLGFVFWAIIMLVLDASGFRGGLPDLTFDFFALTSLIICWLVGGFIGYLIGKKMNYKFPMMQRMPEDNR